MEQSKTGSEIRRVIRKYLLWVVTILIFIYLFNRIEPADVLVAIRKVDLGLFLPLLAIYTLFAFFMDTYVQTFLFKSFGTEVNFRGMLPIRGATYLIVLLNYMIGQGGLALLMNRWKNISIRRAGSVAIFSLYMDYFALLAFCLAGAFRLPNVDMARFFSGGEEGDLVRFVTISWIVFALHFLFYRWFLPRREGLNRFKTNEVLATFREAPFVRYIQVGLLKSTIFIVGIVTNYFALGALGLKVPLLELSVMLPLVWLIGSIPVTVLRLGTIQAAMVWLVTRHAQGDADPKVLEASVLAFSLLWEMGLNVGRFIIGAVSVTLVPRNIWAPKTEEESK